MSANIAPLSHSWPRLEAPAMSCLPVITWQCQGCGWIVAGESPAELCRLTARHQKECFPEDEHIDVPPGYACDECGSVGDCACGCGLVDEGQYYGER